MAEKTIFVNNLNYNVTKEQLAKAFSTFGEIVSARIITERFRGAIVSRGIGFVEFADQSAVERALEEGDDISFGGRKVHVRIANPQRPVKRDTLYVTGFDDNATVDDIKAAFADFSPVDARLVVPSNTEMRRFAFVKFDSEESRNRAGAAAVTLNGKPLMVRFARRPFDAPAQRRGSRRSSRSED